MKRKDYKLIAEQLRYAWTRGDLTQEGLNKLADGLAYGFKRDNSQFDYGRFLNTCGYYRKRD